MGFLANLYWLSNDRERPALIYKGALVEGERNTYNRIKVRREKKKQQPQEQNQE